MGNENKLSKEQLKEFLAGLSEEKNREKKVDVNDFVEKNLTPQQSQVLAKALENPEMIKSLLNSPQAKLLMKKILGGDKK